MGLDRLIETERRNEDLLRRAREEAARVIQAASDAATHRRESLATELAGELARHEATIRAERERRMAAVEREATEAVARYEAVSDGRVQVAAAALIERLLSEEAS